jgi:hypothetical protein
MPATNSGNPRCRSMEPRAAAGEVMAITGATAVGAKGG